MGWLYKMGYRDTKLTQELVNHVTPASKETMAKLEEAFVKNNVGAARRSSFERLFQVDKRGYWGEKSAIICIQKLGGQSAS